MTIFLISFADFDYDGRLRELYKVFKEIGDLKVFFKSSKTEFAHQCLFKGNSYREFIRESVLLAKKLGKIDVLVVDNRRACIPALKIAKKCHPKTIIQDCRELYFTKDVKHIAGKIGCYFEKKLMRIADLVIAANKERAEIMDKTYKLKHNTLVFENLRKLEYSSNVNFDLISNKLGKYICDNEYRIVSTSGCILSRGSKELVEAFLNVKEKARLLLVGYDKDPDRTVIENTIIMNNIANVDILGNLNQDELKWLIDNSHIGIVNYNQIDENNKYCASGKLFEFIYEGIPVVTTTNPPLKRLCDSNGIGVADDAYFNGINMVLNRYEEFKEKALAFGLSHTVESNNNLLMNSVIKFLREQK